MAGDEIIRIQSNSFRTTLIGHNAQSFWAKRLEVRNLQYDQRKHRTLVKIAQTALITKVMYVNNDSGQ